MQAAGSWSLDGCCAVPGNTCGRGRCLDQTSSSDWLFGLWPGPPQRFEPTGTNTHYQYVWAGHWPAWGHDGDLKIGSDLKIGIGGEGGACHQGGTYRGASGEICGGNNNWGATDVEVWYPRTGH